MKEISLVYPHQLFDEHPAISHGRDVLLIEDPLFFGDYKYPLNFHKMKLTFHRASMKSYENNLKEKKFTIYYMEYTKLKDGVKYLFKWLKKNDYKKLHFTEVDDFILNKRLVNGAEMNNLILAKYENPSFLNSHEYLSSYFSTKKSYFQHYFYVDQRKKYEVLLENGNPQNGKWSFDSENRRSVPKNLKIPDLKSNVNNNVNINEAINYVKLHFPQNLGNNDNFFLPVDSSSAKKWLHDFFLQKLKYFGDYQDAIMADQSFLFHSLLSPSINSGLLTPKFVLSETLKFASENRISINSLEGFIRQILGWREFIRAVYLLEGVRQRNSNFWKNSRKMPQSFYDGSTGIEPIDITVKKLLQTGYNHHIERLMLLGNFMLLCEIHPSEVYNWFMEMYIDSYDWVMVPNVYGMSQFADGGIMSTKPYISSSNYIRKMSDFKAGEWTKIWDSLFWHFIHKHKEYFLSNNRTIFIGRNLTKMSPLKLQDHLKFAKTYLKKLK